MLSYSFIFNVQTCEKSIFTQNIWWASESFLPERLATPLAFSLSSTWHFFLAILWRMDAFSRNLPATEWPQMLNVEQRAASSNPLGLIPVRAPPLSPLTPDGSHFRSTVRTGGGWLYTKLPLQQHRGSIWRSISYTDDPAMSWSLVEAKAAGRESLVKRSAFWRSDPLLFSFSSHIRSETHKRCQQGTKSKRKGWAASRHNNRCIKVNTCIRLKTSKTVSQEGADFFVIGALSFVFRDSSWVNVLRETQETSPVRDIC